MVDDNLKYHLFIIDDDRKFVASITYAIKGFYIASAYDTTQAKTMLDNQHDLILLDLVFDEDKPEELQGLELLSYLKREYPDIPVVVMTNYTTIDKAVMAIKAGAEDFLSKGDAKWPEWSLRLRQICDRFRLIRTLREKASQSESITENSEIIGVSEDVKYLRSRLRDLAENSPDASIFLYGETGTGKNLAARYFRKYSCRRKGPYREVSLIELTESLVESELFGHSQGAFTGATRNKKGLFEEADGGILFLDEIGDSAPKVQQKIMRFLEDKTITPVGSTRFRKIDTQLILATNQDINQLLKNGMIRHDLYQRINRIKIELPPLRSRSEDIIPLTNYFFNHFRIKEKTYLKDISKDVYNIFVSYPWPGNVRELQSVIWEACTKARMLKSATLLISHLRDELLCDSHSPNINEIAAGLFVQKANIELSAIEEALIKAKGRKINAARLLGINSDQMRYAVLKYLRKDNIDMIKYNNIKRYYGQLFKYRN